MARTTCIEGLCSAGYCSKVTEANSRMNISVPRPPCHSAAGTLPRIAASASPAAISPPAISHCERSTLRGWATI